MDSSQGPGVSCHSAATLQRLHSAWWSVAMTKHRPCEFSAVEARVSQLLLRARQCLKGSIPAGCSWGQGKGVFKRITERKRKKSHLLIFSKEARSLSQLSRAGTWAMLPGFHRP